MKTIEFIPDFEITPVERIKHKTREAWLHAASDLLRKHLKKAGGEVPKKIQVGCGWPHGGRREVIGQCFTTTWTEDGTTHIFISPTQDNAVSVLATLAHELVHAAVGCQEGHRGKFKKVARALGLEGKLTATEVTAKSPLHPVLEQLSKKLGKYPHSKMIAGRGKRATGGSVNWVRLCSPVDPTYTVVISRRSLATMGHPMDPSGKKMIGATR